MNKKYVPSPIYYTGNKFRLLKKIIPYFPNDIKNFYDVFGGSGVVSLNVDAEKIHYNEIDFPAKLMERLLSRTPEEEVERVVNQSKAYDFPEKDIWKDDTTHPVRLKFKEDFYKNVPEIRKTDLDEILFWQHFSFSNKIEFKKNGLYDLSIGMRVLKPNLYLNKLKNLHSRKNKIYISNLDFIDFISINLESDLSQKKDKFFYLDPPYLASTRVTYGGWNKELESKLLKVLDIFITNDIKFALSNSLEVRENKNELLINWVEKNKDKLKVVYLDHNTTLGAGDKTTGKKNNNVEVLITNYKGETNE